MQVKIDKKDSKHIVVKKYTKDIGESYHIGVHRQISTKFVMTGGTTDRTV